MYDDKSKYQSLSINHIPFTFTFSLNDDSSIIVSDTTFEEEKYKDGIITIAMNVYHDICLIHKPGGSLTD